MKFLTLLVVCILMTSCTGLVQIYETKPIGNIKDEGNSYVFENDTLRIEYKFWTNKGTLNYTIYNKLTIPLYVDWKKSSFFANDKKNNYWNDIEVSNSSTKYDGASVSGQYLFLANGKRYLLTSSVGQSYTNSIKLRPERISFIAPHSKYEKIQFTLMPYPVLLSDAELDKGQKQKVDSVPFGGQSVTIYHNHYTMEQTPLTFRNFITISTNEKMDNEFYVDNGFYVSGIYEMTHNAYRGKLNRATSKYVPFFKTNLTEFYNDNVKRDPKQKLP